VIFFSFLEQACGGLTYTYAVYSGHLKAVLHHTQEQTNNVGAAKDFGAILGLISGFFYRYYPPWVTISIGAILHLFGYSMVCPPHSNGMFYKKKLFSGIGFEEYVEESSL